MGLDASSGADGSHPSSGSQLSSVVGCVWVDAFGVAQVREEDVLPGVDWSTDGGDEAGAGGIDDVGAAQEASSADAGAVEAGCSGGVGAGGSGAGCLGVFGDGGGILGVRGGVAGVDTDDAEEAASAVDSIPGCVVRCVVCCVAVSPDSGWRSNPSV